MWAKLLRLEILRIGRDGEVQLGVGHALVHADDIESGAFEMGRGIK